mmetsp:Transcript_21711/g.50589  ORF Transcript_21711/g.50589 Transcript_21711/m.50589 type:complete len:216 (-) Transcript_21711:81-728(-)
MGSYSARRTARARAQRRGLLWTDPPPLLHPGAIGRTSPTSRRGERGGVRRRRLIIRAAASRRCSQLSVRGRLSAHAPIRPSCPTAAQGQLRVPQRCTVHGAPNSGRMEPRKFSRVCDPPDPGNACAGRRRVRLGCVDAARRHVRMLGSARVSTDRRHPQAQRLVLAQGVEVLALLGVWGGGWHQIRARLSVCGPCTRPEGLQNRRQMGFDWKASR